VPIASFIAIGDWGYYRGFSRNGDFRVEWSLANDQCQKKIADKMHEEVRRLKETNAPVKFVLNAGDSFYPAGINSLGDSKWEQMWGDIYHSMPPETPWYSTYGNHDYGQGDRSCACSGSSDLTGAGCVQVRKHGYKTQKSKQIWYMPAINYYKELEFEGMNPNARVELVVLDLNFYDSHIQCTWISCTSTRCSNCSGHHERCQNTGGYPADGSNSISCNMNRCRETMEARSREAAKMLEQRIKAAERSGAQVRKFWRTSKSSEHSYSVDGEV